MKCPNHLKTSGNSAGADRRDGKIRQPESILAAETCHGIKSTGTEMRDFNLVYPELLWQPRCDKSQPNFVATGFTNTPAGCTPPAHKR
jgi:hypothetical protein